MNIQMILSQWFIRLEVNALALEFKTQVQWIYDVLYLTKSFLEEKKLSWRAY